MPLIGVKVGRNAPKRSFGVPQFGQKRSGAQTSDYLGRNARSTAHKNVLIMQRFGIPASISRVSISVL